MAMTSAERKKYQQELKSAKAKVIAKAKSGVKTPSGALNSKRAKADKAIADRNNRPANTIKREPMGALNAPKPTGALNAKKPEQTITYSYTKVSPIPTGALNATKPTKEYENPITIKPAISEEERKDNLFKSFYEANPIGAKFTVEWSKQFDSFMKEQGLVTADYWGYLGRKYK